MGDNKTNRKRFLAGLSVATVAALIWPRKSKTPSAHEEAKKDNNAVKLPLVAHKAPRAVARENRVS